MLALVAAWSSIALGPAAHAQTSPGVLVTVKPVFPAEVTVGEPLVPASLELASSEILPVLVTSITVDSDGLALSPAALGTGPTCPGVPFGVVPDPSGRSVFIPSAPIVLPPFANVFPATCTIRFTFFSGVAARPAVRTVATLRVFSGLSADRVVSGESTTAVRPAPVTVTVLSGPVPVALGGTVEATAAVIPQFGDQPVPPLVPPPTGSVTFSLYGPDDPACRGRPARVSPDQPLALVLLAHSAALRPSFAGTYRWVGRYSGDAAHAPTSSACSADTSVTGPGVTSTVATTTSTVLATVPTAPAVVPAPVEGPPAQPIRPAPSRSVTPGSLAVYEPSAHATEIVSLQVSVFALLALVGAVPTPGGSGPAPDADSREAGELVATEVESADEGLASTQAVASGAGDRSWTWRSPGTHRLDRISRRGPLVLAPRSPLLARILNDAGYLRAMFGAASMLLPAAGVVLGVLAVADVGGQALPPRLGLAVGLAALGVFDALAGLVGVAVFVVGVVAAGGLVSADAVRTLLGLATLWFAAPLIAGTARPLRRPPTLTFDQHLDRTADVVIASLIGAWAVQKIVQGLPGLAGVELPIASQAGVIALMVLGALVVRMVVETVTAHSYPQRLAAVQPADLPAPGTGQRLAANGLVLAVFVFVAVSYLGLCWQLYVGAALFVTPKLLGLVADRLPSASRLQVLTPRGVVQIVLLLLIGVLLGTHVLANLADGRQLIRDSFVVLSVPGFVVALLELLAGEAPERERRWFYQLLGVPVLTLGVLLALGIVA